MAPMETSKAFEGPTREELETALAGLDAKDLRVTATRLSRSLQDMQTCFDEYVIDSSNISQENRQLRETIDLMVKETRKLNISSANTVQPQLDEGPLDFIGRFWDQVKPRDNVILINEHVGELKRAPQATLADGTPVELPNPVLEKLASTSVVQAGMERFNDAAHALEPLRQSGQEALQASGETFQSLRQSGSEVLQSGTDRFETMRKTSTDQLDKFRSQSGEEVLGSLRQSSTEALQSSTERLASLRKTSTDQLDKFRSQSGEEVLGSLRQSSTEALQSSTERLASLRQTSNEALKSTGETLGALWSAGTVSSWFGGASSNWQQKAAPSDEPGACADAAGDATSTTISNSSEASGSSGTLAAETTPCPSVASSNSAGQSEPAAVPKEEEEEEDNDGRMQDQINSTIIIEAHLKLDDGSIQPLQLRAVDRCKEVAARFVREHSLKAWFEEPLTAYLKQVENDADKFPVKVEADLLEIRKQYSSGDKRRSSGGVGTPGGVAE